MLLFPPVFFLQIIWINIEYIHNRKVYLVIILTDQFTMDAYHRGNLEIMFVLRQNLILAGRENELKDVQI